MSTHLPKYLSILPSLTLPNSLRLRPTYLGLLGGPWLFRLGRVFDEAVVGFVGVWGGGG